MAFAELEPFGARFTEYLSAMQASVLAEVNRNRKKRGRPFSPDEFMQKWGEEDKKATTPEGMLEFVKNYQAAMEVKFGKRSMEDLHKPILYGPHGRPVGGETKPR